jgi:hypothetical protein
MATVYKFVNKELKTTAGKPKSIEELKNIYMTGGYYSQLSNLLSEGVERIMGWCYDYSNDELKEYYYTTHYGTTYKAYAPNKTCLRKAVIGRIYDIVEIK